MNERFRSTVINLFGCFVAVVVLAVLCSWVPAAEQEATAPRVFRAGAHAIDVTPPVLPAIVNGGMTERKSSVVTDPLHARCLVLDDGTTQLAFAVVDSCVLPATLMDAAKAIVHEKLGLKPEQILVSATHAHSTPSVLSVLGSGQNDDYARYLTQRIAEGIVVAHAKLVPARIGWAVGSDPKNVFCRRFIMKPGTAATNPFGGSKDDRAQMNPGYQNPNAIQRTGPVDTDVSVLSVQTRDGKPLAVLGNYSTHYAGAPELSADYFGVFAQRIGELIGASGTDPEFVGIMTNGTSGDANCCDFVNPARKFDYRSVGEDAAQAAFAAYQQIAHQDWVPLAATCQTLSLGVRKPTPDETARAKEFLTGIGDRPPASIPEVYARETVILADWPDTKPVPLQAMRIGSLGIVALPCEAYGSTGLAIKQHSPFKPTFTIDLANGYNGYLPPPDQFPLGGYTTWRARSSYLETQAEVKIRDTAMSLLEQLAK